MRTPRRAWRAGTTALAVALVLATLSQQASALALGRVRILSSLGEPLRAEIDLPQASPEEVASLKASLAGPEAYQAAGLARSPLLQDTQVSLQRRPDGSHVLRIDGVRPINEPSIDLMVDVRWASGQIVRDYTALIDPPAVAATPPVAPLVPALPADMGQAPAPAPAPNPAAPLADTTKGALPGSATPPRPAEASTTAAEGGRRQVQVRQGQTAAGLVTADKPAEVSLDQMLVALLQANPQAFLGGNMNRLKAGAVVDLPSAQEAQALDPQQARQTVIAQSRDFAEFRQRLAQGVASAPPVGDSASRQVSGQVQGQVRDGAPAPASPDRLTLSKGSVEGIAPGGPTQEDRIAKQQADQAAAARELELQRNIAELGRLQAGATAGNAATPASAGSSAPAAGIAAARPPAASAPSGAPAGGSAHASSLSWLEHPMLVWVVGGFSALLLALGLFQRHRQTRLEESVGRGASAGPFSGAGTATPDPLAGRQESGQAPVAVPAGLDLDIESFPVPPLAQRPPGPLPESNDAEGIDPDFATPGATALAAAPPRSAPALAGLSLDLDPPGTPNGEAGPSGAVAPPDPQALANKLALAEEFMALGDTEGARALVAEVVSQATGDQLEQARRLLTELA